jgi:hypothetical protein
MGFLDKVKDATTKATEQAKQVAAAGKEKIDDARLQKKADGLYEEIGKLIVASKRGSAPADLDAQIDAKVAEITEIEQQIEANRAPAEPTGDPVASTPPAVPASPATPAPPAPPAPAQNVPSAPPGPPA